MSFELKDRLAMRLGLAKFFAKVFERRSVVILPIDFRTELSSVIFRIDYRT